MCCVFVLLHSILKLHHLIVMDTIRNLTNQYEILMLQETWLYPDEFSTVSQISDEFQSFNMSSMSLDDKILTCRPHCGLSIMYLSNSIKTLQYDDSRIIGIEVQSNDFTLLVLTVYLPYECDMHDDDYCFYLSKLQCIIDSANTPYIFILGDFNADIQSTSVFGAELIDFCDNNNLLLYYYLLIRKNRYLIHLLLLVKLMVQHPGSTTVLLQLPVNQLHQTLLLLIILFAQTISLFALKLCVILTNCVISHLR